jgi:hypothetical protein
MNFSMSSGTGDSPTKKNLLDKLGSKHIQHKPLGKINCRATGNPKTISQFQVVTSQGV